MWILVIAAWVLGASLLVAMISGLPRSWGASMTEAGKPDQ